LRQSCALKRRKTPTSAHQRHWRRIAQVYRAAGMPRHGTSAAPRISAPAAKRFQRLFCCGSCRHAAHRIAQARRGAPATALSIALRAASSMLATAHRAQRAHNEKQRFHCRVIAGAARARASSAGVSVGQWRHRISRENIANAQRWHRA